MKVLLPSGPMLTTTKKNHKKIKIYFLGKYIQKMIGRCGGQVIFLKRLASIRLTVSEKRFHGPTTDGRTNDGRTDKWTTDGGRQRENSSCLWRSTKKS